MRRLLLPVLATLLASCFAPPTHADDDTPYPVAVRWWGQAMVSIENWHGVSVVVDPFALDIGYDNPQIEANTVCITHEHGDHSNASIIGGEPDVFRGVEEGRYSRVKQNILHVPFSSDPGSAINRQKHTFPEPGAVRRRPRGLREVRLRSRASSCSAAR